MLNSREQREVSRRIAAGERLESMGSKIADMVRDMVKVRDPELAKRVDVKAVGNPEITAQLDELVGQKVTVTWSCLGTKAKGFHPAISLTGELEGHPKRKEYRILPNPDETGTYAYLTPERVIGILPYSGGARVFIG